jgi:Protein of unknown function (DUF5818)
MRKTLMLAAILLLSAAWLQAQQAPQAGSSPANATAASSNQAGSGQSGSSPSRTVEGCLQGSNGNFTLTDNAGMTYQLAGDTSKLTEHVGHEVQIKGSTSGASPADSSAGAAAGGQQTLTVESVKHVAKTCKSAGK